MPHRPDSPAGRLLNYLHTIIDNIGDIIILIEVGPDESYKILYVNKAFTDSVGYTDVVGKQVSEVLPPVVYGPLRQRYQEVITTRHEVRWTTSADTPQGKKQYDVKLLPITNALGECVQMIGITHEL